jgi:hypothetical protein
MDEFVGAEFMRSTSASTESAEWSVIEARFKASQKYRKPLPRKIVCRICGLGPLDGLAVRRIGWTWNCMQHPVKHRM